MTMPNFDIDRVVILTGFTMKSLGQCLSNILAASRGGGEADLSVLRRVDGGPVTDAHRAAVMEATAADLDAVDQHFKRQVEQAEYEAAVAGEADTIFRRYAPSPRSTMRDVLPLMPQADRIRLLELLAQL